ncbi:MAG: class I SAM-dependent methyltransferase [Polyangiaceae bacterium]|nr:class I SAM-dependent methyltransferase [Polyangiaceae bacterium]MCW5790561.1 class I SAM-dependent methyltransferase [Polyangiaceae bacterium]
MSEERSRRPACSATATEGDRIAPTAHYTAYAWFRLGLPYAEWFKTARGARMHLAFRGTEWLAACVSGTPSLLQYLEYRHRAIDHRLTARRPGRVVELGAGLSRRGTTWALDHGASYVELDLAPMIAAKERHLAKLDKSVRLRLTRLLRLEVADVLAATFVNQLTEALRGAERPVVIAEGLLGYFDFDERERLARAIATALRQSGGGHFLCDLRSRPSKRAGRVAVSALKAAIRVVTRGRGAREDFPSREVIRERFLSFGFDEANVCPASEVPELGHLAGLELPVDVWQFEVKPRGLS